MFSMSDSVKYAQVIVPLALEGSFTYSIPEKLSSGVKVGVRVEVQFGAKRHYSAIVRRITDEKPIQRELKPVLSVLDEEAIVDEKHLQLWEWIAEYYCCTVGEVMQAALPAAFRLKSEMRIVRGHDLENELDNLDHEEYLIAEAVQVKSFITIEDARLILEKQTVMPLIDRLYAKGVIDVVETLTDKYKPKTESCIRFLPPYSSGKKFEQAFTLVENAPKQADILLGIIQLSKQYDIVTVKNLRKRIDVSHSALVALENKGIIERYDRVVSRVELPTEGEIERKKLAELSDAQNVALEGVLQAAKEEKVALLHGVTGSGKTEIYAHLIQQAVDAGKQVLYLLPEIALTTQITQRLLALFRDDLVIYHSRLNDSERLEVWKKVLNKERKIILSVRSGVLLPFSELGLVIVDEEHDSSFKQVSPSPRYNARDVAIYASYNMYDSAIVLGSATPSIESFYNAEQNRYAYIPLMDRYKDRKMPGVELRQVRSGGSQSIFAKDLITYLDEDLKEGYQSIIFKNRRGYAPQLYCSNCDWRLECRFCDVSLTYHQLRHKALCHYCGYSTQPPTECPDCGSTIIREKGIGTEKVQAELEILFPDATIRRLDYDSTRKKDAMLDLVSAFENGEIDILVGTQMITKGLNFNNIRTVGVIEADRLFTFPDFRAVERAYQLLHQVSGRAGRGDFESRVLIQASNLNHNIFKWLRNHDYDEMYQQEMTERREFSYPPIIRLINIHLEHQRETVVNEAAVKLAQILRQDIKDTRILGPSISSIPRLKNRYRYDIFLKLRNHAPYLNQVKAQILHRIRQLRKMKGMSQLRVSVDVDPY